MSLVPVDPSNAAAVSDYLSKARDWLATAVEMTGPEQIAAAKAEIATAAEATKQLGLSKEIQLDAQEMVRRAEYALGKAIRKGQEEGTVRVRGQRSGTFNRWNGETVDNRNSTKASPTDFASDTELNGNATTGQAGIMHLAEAAPEQLDAALDEAKAEGNLSRANVVRKVRGQGGTVITRDQRADMICDLANQGYSSRQMPPKVGIAEGTIRLIARDYGIDIPADRVIGRTRRINSTDVVSKTVTALEGLVMGVELIAYDEIDPAEASQWAASLTESLRVLNRFAKQIKEIAQ